jgi:hypothetical protein
MNLSRHAAAAATGLAFLVVIFTFRSVAAANLCPAPVPPITDTDDRRRTEASFDAEDFSQALDYFKDDLPRALRENASTEGVRRKEPYTIGYPNVIVAIEGYTLRQEALLRLAERDLIVERSQRGPAKKADVASVNTRFQEAQRRFCDFLKNAQYSD